MAFLVCIGVHVKCMIIFKPHPQLDKPYPFQLPGTSILGREGPIAASIIIICLYPSPKRVTDTSMKVREKIMQNAGFIL